MFGEASSCNTANFPSYCAGGTVPFLRDNAPKDNAVTKLVKIPRFRRTIKPDHIELFQERSGLFPERFP